MIVRRAVSPRHDNGIFAPSLFHSPPRRIYPCFLASDKETETRSSYSSDVSTARIARAISLVERHLVSRASKSLFQPSLAPLVPSTVEKLRALHPPAAVPASSLPALPESSPRIHVDGKVLTDLVKGKVANGSSVPLVGRGTLASTYR